MRYQPVERDLLIQHLRTHEQETLSFSSGGAHELRLEDYVVRGLIDRDDVDYDSHADFLYGLAGQVVSHIKGYLSEDETRNVLIYHQKQIAAFVYAQMQAHQQESPVEYDVEVKKGFTKLKSSAYTANAGELEHDFRQTVEDKSRISKMVFGGFQRCLFAPVKFQSDTERRLSIIIDREAEKWLRPAKGQFQIYYKSGVEHPEYIPDFVVEMPACIYMLESKARNEIGNAEVTAKKEAAEKWCRLASAHTAENGGKPWQYVLIPHDAIAENMALSGLAKQFGD
jgi:type III restriction enzyme